jgi:CRISP-associated protein Cas1
MIYDASNDVDDKLELLPARMLNEFAYCPRLFYLEHVEGLFADNRFTIEGSIRHKRVDGREDELPPASDTESTHFIHARSVTLSSDRLGVMAKLDLIETNGHLATPVDYKRGAPKKNEDGTLDAWEPEKIQLCVQALVLRDNGFQCDEGILFFWETRQRVRIPIDAALVERTCQIIEQARELMHAPKLPPPLVDSPKCPNCSLVGICLPDETRHCARDDGEEGKSPSTRQLLLFDTGFSSDSLFQQDEPSGSAGGASERPVRQMVTGRYEQKALYVNTPGLTIGKSGEVLKIKDKTKVLQEVRIKDICQLNLMGPIQITTQAMQELLQAEIPVAFFSMGGWYYGHTQSVGLKNIVWRREQFRAADDERFCLRLAKQLIVGKIRNQRTMLMRNHVEPPQKAIQFMKSLIWDAERADSQATLLGIEGLAARTYFENFSGLIKVSCEAPGIKGGSLTADQNSSEKSLNDPFVDDADLATERTTGVKMSFDFKNRNRRPPRDPVNALLSLGYSLLAKDLSQACAIVGLDPYLGYYHQPRFGRPSLALDLMEPFRPLIVDSAVLSAINQRMVHLGHFRSAGQACALTPAGRKAFFMAYEQRMDQLVTHPIFGYRVSYRRVLEIQVRLLARVLMGEIREYPVFITR